MPDSLCFNWIQSYPIDTWLPGATGKIGVGGIILFFLYILSASITLIWVHIQRIRAALGDPSATKYVIFPIYIPYMWASAFSDFLMATLLAVGSVSGSVQVDVEDPNSIPASAGIGIIFGFEHFVIEGIAFILLQFGCGFQSRKTAAKWSLVWGIVTAFVQFCQFRYGSNRVSSVIVNGLWNFVLIVFYGCLWIAPMRTLFRRPALINYARFWCLYRILVFVASILVVVTNTDANNTSQYTVGFRDFCGCLYVVGALVIFAITKPYVIYSALLCDSQWWQGISTAYSTDELCDEMEYYISTPNTITVDNDNTPAGTPFSSRGRGSGRARGRHGGEEEEISEEEEDEEESGENTGAAAGKWSVHSFSSVSTYRKVSSAEGEGDSRNFDLESGGAGGDGSEARKSSRSSRSRKSSVGKPSKLIASNLQNPLQGIEVGYSEARNLAQQVATLRSQGNVKLLNFAYIMLDRTAPLLGSGSFSKVFRGTYRRTPVAIKLLFTPDLNPHVIRRCASEASILSQISRLGGDKFHANVVKIFGVSVLPPSVCIVLEICYYGSLSDVIRGVNYFKPGSSGGVTGRERESFRNSLSMIMAETGRSSFGSNHSGSALSLALEINPAASSGTGSGSPVVRPPLNLTLSDKYFLALGCARGLEALHTYKNNALGLCHRDVKSFNFLVDAQLNAKIADLELSTTEVSRDSFMARAAAARAKKHPVDKSENNCSGYTSSGSDRRSARPTNGSGSSSGGYNDVCNNDNAEEDMYSALLPRESESESASMSVTEQLPVWLAPEVINPGSQHNSARSSPQPGGGRTSSPGVHATHSTPSGSTYTNARYSQASDIYALGLVLWEIMSMKIPYFDECGDSDEAVRNYVLRGLRPKFNTFCRMNTHDAENSRLPQPFSANCNSNGYNTIDSSYIALATECWRQEADKRPKISEIVFRLEEFCWNKTLYSYIRETEHVLDHAIVMKEYRNKCKSTVEKKAKFFSSNFLGNSTSSGSSDISGVAASVGAESRTSPTPAPATPQTPSASATSTSPLLMSPSAVDIDKPPSSAFISSLLNTLKLEPNWMKLDYCTQPEHANSGGGYVVLVATPTAPYLIVWCTKYFLTNSGMPLNNCGLTMNDLLALELTYVLYDYNSKRHQPYKPPLGGKQSRHNGDNFNSMMNSNGNYAGGVGSGSSGSSGGDKYAGKQVLTKVIVANYKVLLNKCIAQTISTGRPTHCVLACYRQEPIYPQHNASPGQQSRVNIPPPGAGVYGGIGGGAADDKLVNYSVHVFPVFKKETTPVTVPEEEDEVASVYDAAVDVTLRAAIDSTAAAATTATTTTAAATTSVVVTPAAEASTSTGSATASTSTSASIIATDATDAAGSTPSAAVAADATDAMDIGSQPIQVPASRTTPTPVSAATRQPSASSMSSRLRQLSTSLFAGSSPTLTSGIAGAGVDPGVGVDSSTATPTPATPASVATPAVDKSPTVAYVVIQFSSLNLPPLAR